MDDKEPPTAPVTLDWVTILLEQLTVHWTVQLRPRLTGLTDEEWAWEPAPGCWGVRPRGTSTAPMAVGTGDWTIDFAVPQPDPAPVTTIAWRMAHLVVGCLGGRAASHFGGPAMDYVTYPYAGNAGDALAQLDEAYANWTDGVRSLTPEQLALPVGAAEGEHADAPMAGLVLHISRETIHHGAEISLLRDLYLRRPAD